MPTCVSDDTRILTGDTLEELAESAAICGLVEAMRGREDEVRRLLDEADSAVVRRACRQAALDLLPEPEACASLADMDSPGFAYAVYGLPRDVRTAPHRRAVREIARVYSLLCGGGLPVPGCADDFHRLWEAAMEGEPRWDAGYPTSAFRSNRAVIRKSMFSDEVLQVCTDPGDFERELDRLVSFLGDARLLPEVRAACAYALLEWTHPFMDGNGHTGRTLLLSALQDRYSLLSMTFFSRALCLGRDVTCGQFALLREGKGGLAGFCAATLAQLGEAQLDATRALEQVAGGESWHRHAL